MIPDTREVANPNPPSGSVASNTTCSNPIGFGEAFGYVDDTTPPKPQKKVDAQSYLTDYCRSSAIFERFNGDGAPMAYDGPTPPKPRRSDGGGFALAFGIDSLTLSVNIQFAPSVLETLQELKERAASGRVVVASGPFRFELLAFGLSPHWRFVLKGPAATIKMRARETFDLNAQIDVRSQLLWSLGPQGAIDLLTETLQRWALQDVGRLKGIGVPVSERSIGLDVSRLDLCADFLGQPFDGTEMASGRFITRARKRTVYTLSECHERETVEGWHIEAIRKRLESAKEGHSLSRLRADVLSTLGAKPETRGERIGEHVRQAAYTSGRTLTGFSFGAGHLVCRIYRKDIEIKQSKKLWFRDIWRERGYERDANGFPPVWRVEFQIRAEALRTFYSEGRPLRTWKDVAQSLDALWAQLTGRPGGKHKGSGWLSFRDAGTDKKRERWPINRWWRDVQLTHWSDSTSLERISRGQVVRRGQAIRPRTREQTISAWCAGSTIGARTGQAAAAQLGPQLAGIGAAYAAALQLGAQLSDPQTQEEARSRVLAAVSDALDDAGNIAQKVSTAADRLSIRANWRSKTQRDRD